MDEVEVKMEEDEPEMYDMEYTLDTRETDDDIVPPMSEPEPIIGFSASRSSVAQQHDPLSTDCNVTPVQNFVNIATFPHIKTEVEEIDLEPATEMTSASYAHSDLPETTPCAILLDTSEVMKYYCSRTEQFLSETSQRKKIWEIPCKIEANTPKKRSSGVTSSYSESDSSVTNTQSYSESISDMTLNPKHSLRKPKFSCKYCKKKFKTKLSLKYHMKNHQKYFKKVVESNSKPTSKDMSTKPKNNSKIQTNFSRPSTSKQVRIIKCRFCSDEFTTVNEHKNHLITEHDCLHSCNYCSKLFKSSVLLKFHIQRHLDELFKMQSCSECSAEFETTYELKKHIVREHKKKKVKLFRCKNCDNAFFRMSRLQYHCTMQHPGMTFYSCQICGYNKFLTKLQVKRHMIELHIKNYYSCKICNDIKFTRKASFLRHAKNTHYSIAYKINKNKIISSENIPNELDKKFKCIACNYSCQKNRTFRNHLKNAHYIAQKYICEYCQVDFVSKQNLLKHQTSNKVCIKIRKNIAKLKTHKDVKECTKNAVKVTKNNTQVPKNTVSLKLRENLAVKRVSLASAKSKKELKNKSLVCSYCKLQHFKHETELHRHIKLKHIIKTIIECKICNIKLANKNEAENHLELNHDNIKCKIEGQFIIEIQEEEEEEEEEESNSDASCNNDNFIESGDSSAHELSDVEMSESNNESQNNSCKVQENCNRKPKLEENDDNNIFTCNVCKLVFNLQSSLIEHMNIHTKPQDNLNPNLIIKRELCSKELTSQPEIRILEKSDKKSFNCEFCQRSFKTKSNHDSHVTRHLIKQPFKCDYCDTAVVDRELLKVHNESVHNVTKTEYTCDLCHKNDFLNKFDVENHLINDHLNSNYNCSTCDVSFISENDFNLHIKIFHTETFKLNNLFVCNICDKKFYNIANLTMHVKLHTNNIETNESTELINNNCKICQLHFDIGSNSKLAKHLLSHSIIKIYKCDHCALKFDQICTLKTHCKNVHKNIKNMTCDICKRTGFVSKLHIENHILCMHLKCKNYCKICRIYCSSKKQWKLHLQKKHFSNGLNAINIFNDINCTEELKETLRSNNINTHSYVLQGGDRCMYVCQFCDLSFRSNVGWMTHMNVYINPFLPQVKQAKNILICLFCYKECKNKGTLKTHILKNHKSKNTIVKSNDDLKCIHCEHVSNNRQELNKHLALKHSLKYSCEICNRKFKNESCLYQHQKNIHFNFNCKIINNQLINCDSNKPPRKNCRKYRCHKCPVSYSRKSTLQRHLQQKHNIEITNNTCQYCDTVFDTENLLINHIHIVHGLQYPSQNTTTFQCKFCTANFIFEFQLNKHLTNHSILKPFKCDICDIKFTIRSSMKLHYQNIHKINSIYDCDICKRDGFVIKFDIENHIIRKHMKTPYFCPVCRIPFRNKLEYKNHNKIPHFKNSVSDLKTKIYKNATKHVCSQCSRVYVTKKSLTKHFRQNHMIIKKGIYTCNLCGYQCIHTSQMLVHLKFHDINLPFQCNLCHKLFNIQSDVKLHIANKHLKTIFENTSSYNFTYSNHVTVLNNENDKQELVNKVTTFKEMDTNNIKLKQITKTIYSCSECNKKCSTLQDFRTHKDAHNVRCYTCFVCKQSFKRYKDLKIHLVNMHNPPKILECNYCNMKFHFKSSLAKHIKKQHNILLKSDGIVTEAIIENYSHFCIICNLMLENENDYTAHCNELHSEIEESKNNILICEICKITCSTIEELTAHISNCEGKKMEKLKHNCLLCSQAFNSNTALKIHVNDKHDIKGTCPYCDLYYMRLCNHIVKVHLDISEYKCKYCPETFIGKLNLKNHEDVKHTFEKFKRTCKICKEVFHHAKLLKEHMKSVHHEVKRFLCHFCGHDCEDSGHLKTHMITKHSDVKPVRTRINCPYCTGSYYSSGELNRHISRSHKKDKLQCTECDFKSASVYTLRYHKYVIHKIGYVKRDDCSTGDFECPGCFRRYKAQNTMFNHYNREHLPCVCDICDRQLQGKHSMEKHLEYSHGMKEKVYPCKKCKHVALTPGRLQKHLVVKHKKKR